MANIIKPENKTIWTIENSSHEKFLRTPVSVFDIHSVSRKDLDELIIHMRKLMVNQKGVGLSANQIGLSIRMFICQLPASNGFGYQGKLYAVFNPIIKKLSEKKVCDEEGCLSIPGLYGEVERFHSITVTGFDKNNRAISLPVRGQLARIMQHEIDHLNGILFTDHARNIQRISEL